MNLLLPLFLTFLLALPLTAQNIFFNPGGNRLSFGTETLRSSSISGGDVGDFNNDGWIDILVGNVGEVNCVYQNLGDGKRFTRIPLSDQTYDTYDIQFADLNGDGFPDVVEANSDGLNVYYANFLPSQMGN